MYKGKHFENILIEALIRFSDIDKSTLGDYVASAKREGKSLRDYLIDSNIFDDNKIVDMLAMHLNMERVDLNKVEIEKRAIDKVPAKFAWYYKIMPIKIEGDILVVASGVPLDISSVDEIRLHLGLKLKIVLTSEKSLLELLKKCYGFASDTIERIIEKNPMVASATTVGTGQWVEDIERSSDDPNISNLVNQIILEAYKKRATDIHIEPYRDKVRFRYRIDGVLMDANLPQTVRHFLPSILSRIKILANLSITEKRIPQDGSAVVKTKDQQIDLRVSTMPTPRGESMVIRILPTKVMFFSLEKLGFNKDSIEKLRALLKKPHGIIFMTGPTGSGKTTTLYACLNEINSPHRKIITIEDPIEYEMEGITQVQVNPKVNFDFSTGLRSLLRHDPDIIMVGEVRDVETAEIAIRTALTGHLVFSTLHTNDAASGITRLIDMGIEPYLVASSIEAFVAQRLVRVICPRCKQEDNTIKPGIKDEILRSLRLSDVSQIKIYKGVGCEYCNYTGFYGRIAIYEILTLNDAIESAILTKPRSDYIKRIAIQEGLVTLRQNGWMAVLDGVTTPEEVMAVTVQD